MTAGTSLSEAALGRPSLLQAAVCYPSLSEAAVVITSLSEAGTSTEHQHPSSRHPAPAPSTGITSTSLHHAQPAPNTGAQSPPRAASSQLRRRRPLSLPRALPAPSTGTVSPPRAQPSHSTQYRHHSQAPAPGTGTQHCLESACSQLIIIAQLSLSGEQAHSQHPIPAPGAGARHTVSTTRTASTHHQHRHPGTLPPPRAQPAHSISTSTGCLSRKRAQAAHCCQLK